MSLYGTGRREGITTTVSLVAIVMVVHVAARAMTAGTAAVELPDALWPAALPALASITFYRFLRSLHHSRYAAFVASAAYALSPWLTAIDVLPREQLAAALAPLALEATCRSVRPQQRRR